MVSNHEVPPNGFTDTRNFYTQLIQHPHAPSTSGQAIAARRIIPVEQHQSHIDLSRMHRNEQQYIIHAATTTRNDLRLPSTRYTPNFDVTSMRQRHQSAAMGGNMLRINANGTTRAAGVREYVDNTFGNMNDIKKQSPNIESAAFATCSSNTGPRSKISEKQKSRKEVTTNSVIEISDNKDIPLTSPESGKRGREPEPEQHASSTKKNRMVATNTPAVQHDEYYCQALADLQSVSDRPDINQTQVSAFIKLDVSMKEEIAHLAGPFVQGIFSNDEKAMKCAISDACRELGDGIKEQIQQKLSNIITMSNVNKESHGASSSDPTRKSETEKDMKKETANNSEPSLAPIQAYRLKKDKFEREKEIDGTNLDTTAEGFTISRRDIEKIATNVLTNKNINIAFESVVKKAIKIAYVEVKNRHDAILSREKVTSTDAVVESTTKCISLDNRSKAIQERTINELKEKHAMQLKALRANQQATIDKLVVRHDEEMSKLRDDNSRMLKCALLASSHALKIVRGKNE